MKTALASPGVLALHVTELRQLIATALYIVSVGLYELFIGEVKLAPHLDWLKITTLDELKDRLTVAFLAIAASRTGDDVLPLNGDACEASQPATSRAADRRRVSVESGPREGRRRRWSHPGRRPA